MPRAARALAVSLHSSLSPPHSPSPSCGNKAQRSPISNTVHARDHNLLEVIILKIDRIPNLGPARWDRGSRRRCARNNQDVSQTPIS